MPHHEFRAWGLAIVDCLITGRAEGSMRPTFALAALRSLVCVVRDNQISLDGCEIGPWQAGPWQADWQADSLQFQPGVGVGAAMVHRGRVAVVLDGFLDPAETAAVLNWCERSPLGTR